MPAAVASFCLAASALTDELSLVARAGSGIVVGHIRGDLTPERAAVILKELQEKAVGARGNVVVPQCPVAWKRSLPVWGVPRGDAWMMRRIKETFDPRGIFNPGRFLAG